MMMKNSMKYRTMYVMVIFILLSFPLFCQGNYSQETDDIVAAYHQMDFDKCIELSNQLQQKDIRGIALYEARLFTALSLFAKEQYKEALVISTDLYADPKLDEGEGIEQYALIKRNIVITSLGNYYLGTPREDCLDILYRFKAPSHVGIAIYYDVVSAFLEMGYFEEAMELIREHEGLWESFPAQMKSIYFQYSMLYCSWRKPIQSLNYMEKGGINTHTIDPYVAIWEHLWKAVAMYMNNQDISSEIEYIDSVFTEFSISKSIPLEILFTYIPGQKIPESIKVEFNEVKKQLHECWERQE